MLDSVITLGTENTWLGCRSCNKMEPAFVLGAESDWSGKPHPKPIHVCTGGSSV